MVPRKTVNKKDKSEENEGPLAVYCNQLFKQAQNNPAGFDLMVSALAYVSSAVLYQLSGGDLYHSLYGLAIFL